MHEPSARLPAHEVGTLANPTAGLVIHDDEVVVRLSGALDSRGAEPLRLHLLTLVGDDVPALVVDLSDVHTLDAAGAHPLVEANRLMRRRGADFSLRGVSPQIAVAVDQAWPPGTVSGVPRKDAAPIHGARVLVGPWPPRHDPPVTAG